MEKEKGRLKREKFGRLPGRCRAAERKEKSGGVPGVGRGLSHLGEGERNTGEGEAKPCRSEEGVEQGTSVRRRVVRCGFKWSSED